MLKLFIIIISLFYNYSAFGNQLSSGRKIDLFQPLKKTPSALIVDNISKPYTFNKSNNLTRKSGSFFSATGNRLIIYGKITDSFGVPIGGATIKIWQRNAAGKYQTIIADKSPYFDKYFLGSGQTISDNLGNFKFITIFPGFEDDRAPNINLLLNHDQFGLLETEFYFDGHPKNINDSVYNMYNSDDIKLLTGKTKYINNNPEDGMEFYIDIVLEGVHEYKKY